jgi:hypothetical protein
MYSVVLMAAMVTTPEMPEFGRKSSGCCGQTECGSCGSSCGHSKKHRGSSCGCCGQMACGCCGQTACGCCGQTACGGCGSSCGSCAPACGCYGAPAAPAAPAPTAPPPKPMGALSPTSGTVVVLGAADAKVTIGGLLSGSTAEMRVMVTPTLEAGQVYYYDLTAEVQGVKLTQAVTVRAGVLTEVNLDFAGRTVAMK